MGLTLDEIGQDLNLTKERVRQLKELASLFLNIHGQHENQNLLDVNNHLLYLDSFAYDTLHDVLESYKDVFDKYQNINGKIQRLKGNEDSQNNISFLKYQIEDIDAMKLKDGEEETLIKERDRLSNLERINKQTSTICRLLRDSEKGNAYDVVRRAETVEGQKLQRGRTVNDDVIILIQHISIAINPLLQDSLSTCLGNQLELRSSQTNVSGDDIQVGKLPHGLLRNHSLCPNMGRILKNIADSRPSLISGINTGIVGQIGLRIHVNEKDLVLLCQNAANVEGHRCLAGSSL